MTNEDEYSWHDLRKNPNDIPNHSNDVLTIYVHNGTEDYQYCIEPYDEEAWKKDEWYETIAWREIEPFEDGEES